MKALAMAIFLLGLTFIACKKDKEEFQNRALTTSEVSTAVQLQVNGFSRTNENENWPSSYTATYANSNNLIVQFGVASPFLGLLINVDDAIVNANFINPSGVVKRTVNGVDIYENLDGNVYRALMFRGQYSFNLNTIVEPQTTGKTAVESFATALATNLGNIK